MTPTHKGILILVASTAVFAAQDSLTKFLAQSMPVSQFIGMRYAAFFLFALWWACRQKPLKQVFNTVHPVRQCWRGALLACEMGIFALIVKHIGVSEMHAIFASFPLMVTALSPWILKERVGWRRFSAVAVGFAGTLVILAPGSSAFSLYSLGALLCALMFALYNLETRYVSQRDSAETSLVYTAFVGLLIYTPYALWHWSALDLVPALQVALLCGLGVLSHFLLIQALSLAPAVVLQPFNYFTLPWAIVIGFFAFGEVLQWRELFGAALVVSSGVYVALRQRQLEQADQLSARPVSNEAPGALSSTLDPLGTLDHAKCPTSPRTP